MVSNYEHTWNKGKNRKSQQRNKKIEKNTIFRAKTELRIKKNLLDGLSSKMEETQDQISELENKMIKITRSEQQREKTEKNNEQSLKASVGP